MSSTEVLGYFRSPPCREPGFLTLRSGRGLLSLGRVLLIRSFKGFAWNKLMEGHNLPGTCARWQMSQKLRDTCVVRHVDGWGVFLESSQGILQAIGPPILLSVAQKPRAGMPANHDRNFCLCLVAQFNRTRRALEIETASLLGRLQLSSDGTTNLIHGDTSTPLQCLEQ
jgi:hypothetical protein